MTKTVLILFARSDVHKSEMTLFRVDSLMLKLKNGACSNDTQYVIVGNSRKFFFSASFLAISVTISESVDIGKCGPCCSIEPTGITATCFFPLMIFLRLGSNLDLISVI